MTKAVAYIRTSSATNVGADKDSDKRQREAITRCAAHQGYEIVAEFNDPAVSGKDPIETRPGFSALLDRIDGNGVRTVIIEDASRFARDLMTQELGIMLMIQRGVKVITSNGDDLTETDDDMRIAMRQIMGVFAQLEKQRLVKKLKVARDRKKATGVKVEGRKSHSEMNPDHVAIARALQAEGNTLRQIAAALTERGMTNEKAAAYSPAAVMRMVK